MYACEKLTNSRKCLCFYFLVKAENLCILTIFEIDTIGESNTKERLITKRFLFFFLNKNQKVSYHSLRDISCNK